jgi:Predicted endonuclease distantly related to archaeal Holliday junction resolvase
MANHNNLGKEGELAAIAYLKKKGYHILHTNWQRGHLKFDIITKNNKIYNHN